MSGLGRIAACSVLATLSVGVWGAAQKVRIDSRAHLLTGDGWLASARRSGSRDELLAAGRAYLGAMRCYVPFDRSSMAASKRLEAVVVALERQRASREARALIDEALAGIDAGALFFTPLAAERAALVRLRERPTVGPVRLVGGGAEPGAPLAGDGADVGDGAGR